MIKDRLVYGVKLLGAVASGFLPEGRFKEILRSCFWNRFDPLYALNKLIVSTELQPDSSLFFELNNGTRFYAPRDEIPYRRISKMGPRKLNNMRHF